MLCTHQRPGCIAETGFHIWKNQGIQQLFAAGRFSIDQRFKLSDYLPHKLSFGSVQGLIKRCACKKGVYLCISQGDIIAHKIAEACGGQPVRRRGKNVCICKQISRSGGPDISLNSFADDSRYACGISFAAGCRRHGHKWKMILPAEITGNIVNSHTAKGNHTVCGFRNFILGQRNAALISGQPIRVQAD